MEANQVADGAQLGMEHPAVMASLQARLDGHLFARSGEPIYAALARSVSRSRALFGDVLSDQDIAARVRSAYAEAGVKP